MSRQPTIPNLIKSLVPVAGSRVYEHDSNGSVKMGRESIRASHQSAIPNVLLPGRAL